MPPVPLDRLRAVPPAGNRGRRRSASASWRSTAAKESQSPRPALSWPLVASRMSECPAARLGTRSTTGCTGQSTAAALSVGPMGAQARARLKVPAADRRWISEASNIPSGGQTARQPAWILAPRPGLEPAYGLTGHGSNRPAGRMVARFGAHRLPILPGCMPARLPESSTDKPLYFRERRSTPGVTGRCRKSMFMRVGGRFVFQRPAGMT
jgi:hypothetical protein